MAGKNKYDVFLSHHEADIDPVEWVARQLIDEGVTPFLDIWHLVPGKPWQEALELALGECASVAVFLGPSGIGPWHNEQMYAALMRGVDDHAFRLIPVLLPGATMPEKGQMSPFLSRRTWVDFRKNLEDPEILNQLICGIRGLPPGPGLVAPAQFGERSPYLGLEKFQPGDAPWFFGREAETQQLIERLKSTRFLAVIGASGSGKSSLVLAGLVPALQNGGLPGSESWPYRIFTPTAQPLEELAVNLSRLLPNQKTSDLLRELEKEPRALHLAVRDALADAPSDQQVLLIIDQFEEAFTVCQSEPVRQIFFKNLLYAAEQVGGRTVIVLTMRADFIAKAANYAGLADKLSSFQFIVTPLEKEQLRQVIERPAAIAGLQLDTGLTDQILEDVSNQPGSLPLLEHALFELWKLRQRNRLTFSAYSEIGGVAGALARTADNTYQSLNENQQEIARRILLELVQPGEGTEDTRRRALRSELVSRPDEERAVETVLQRLADQRLVTINRELVNDDAVVNVAHEALIRNWPVLQQWINKDRESLRFQRKLWEAVEEWQTNHHGEDYLYRGSRLAQLKEWEAEPDSELNEAERKFLEASIARELAEQKANRKVATFRKRTIYLTVALALVLLVATTTALLVNENMKFRAEINRLTQANQLSSQALATMNENIDLASLLAVEAFMQKDTQTTQNSLFAVLEYSPHLKKILPSPVGEIYAVAFSHNGQWIAVGGSKSTIQILDSQTFLPVGDLIKGHKGPIKDLAFSTDDRYLASSSDDMNVILWDLESQGKKKLELVSGSGTTHNHKATEAIFSPNGEAVITASYDKTFRLWNNLSQRWKGQNTTFDDQKQEDNPIFSLAWQPGGDLLAVGNLDSSIDLWQISTDRSFTPLRKKPGKTNIGAIGDLEYSPDGQYLVAGGYNSIIRYWAVKDILSPDPSLKNNQFPAGAELGRHQLRVNSLAFSPDGRYLATSGSDKMVILWDFKDHRQIARLLGHQLGVGSVTFSQDGKTLISGGNDELLMVWDTSPIYSVLKAFPVNLGSTSRFAFGPDGKSLSVLTCPEQPDSLICTRAEVIHWIIENDQVTNEMPLEEARRMTSLASSRSGDSFFIAACKQSDEKDICSSSEIIHVDSKNLNGKTSLIKDLPGTIESFAVSPDNQQLASGTCIQYDTQGICLEGMIQLWEIQSGEEISHTVNNLTHSMVFSPDGKYLVAGGCAEPNTKPEEVTRSCIQGGIYLWEANASKGTSSQSFQAHEDGVAGLAFSPSGKLLASGSCVQWDVAGECTQSEIRLWDTETWQFFGLPLNEQPGQVSSLAFAEDGKALLSANSNGGIFRWDMDPDSWARSACQRASRLLTPAELERYFPKQKHEQACEMILGGK